MPQTIPDREREKTESRQFRVLSGAVRSYCLPAVLTVLALVLIFAEGSVLSGLCTLAMAAYFFPAVRKCRKKLPAVVNVLIFPALLAAFYFSMYLYI